MYLCNDYDVVLTFCKLALPRVRRVVVFNGQPFSKSKPPQTQRHGSTAHSRCICML